MEKEQKNDWQIRILMLINGDEEKIMWTNTTKWWCLWHYYSRFIYKRAEHEWCFWLESNCFVAVSSTPWWFVGACVWFCWHLMSFWLLSKLISLYFWENSLFFLRLLNKTKRFVDRISCDLNFSWVFILRRKPSKLIKLWVNWSMHPPVNGLI